MEKAKTMFLEVREKEQYLNIYVCFLVGDKLEKKMFAMEPRFVTPRSKAYFYKLVSEAKQSSEATTLEDC